MENKENENQKVVRNVVKSLVKQVIKSEKEIDKNHRKKSSKNVHFWKKLRQKTVKSLKHEIVW